MKLVNGWFFSAVSLLVPSRQRVDWAREWRAEVWHLLHDGRQLRIGLDGHGAELSLARGMVVDALWLRWDSVRVTAPGSAAGCLLMLLAGCVASAGMERLAVGSWVALLRVLEACFRGGFVFVAAPALVVALVTYPLRPLRCDGADGKLFSVRAQWNLFLFAKVLLTLLLGFLGIVVVMAPVRMEIRELAGFWPLWAGDSIEMLLWAGAVTVGLRWALLNQEQRCQKCLRMLGTATRVGPPSRNFLDWSGTELACAEGHGLLQVAEMPGSWCWFDVWRVVS